MLINVFYILQNAFIWLNSGEENQCLSSCHKHSSLLNLYWNENCIIIKVFFYQKRESKINNSFNNNKDLNFENHILQNLNPIIHKCHKNHFQEAILSSYWITLRLRFTWILLKINLFKKYNHIFFKIFFFLSFCLKFNFNVEQNFIFNDAIFKLIFCKQLLTRLKFWDLDLNQTLNAFNNNVSNN